MGRNENRQTAKFSFSTYKIEMYRPTQGQGAAITVAGSKASKGSDPDSIVRFFRVLEALTVNPDNWAAMDDALVMGDVDLDEFMDLSQAVFGYDWDGEAAKTKALAEQMQAKAVNG